MRCDILILLLVQCLGGSGLPLFDLTSKADEALRMALDEINTRYAQHHLYRVAKASVTRVVPLGMNTYDMMLKFGIRETDCRKDSGVDPQGCAYRRAYFVSEAGCYIRVHLADTFTNIISFKCSPAQSSSSELDEMMVTGWHFNPNHLVSRQPVSTTAAPISGVTSPVHTRHPNNFNIRGEDFSNYLE
ncbi:secreted phosphoprotein 24 [Trichomycterus rosablanca]|uniref:secreted phosphoprotein 24 n=1 Tax=Trichomycterus rosablanca TaxID=2290929 RepID=UPI002F352B20